MNTPRFNWKTLGILATVVGGLVTIAAGFIEDKKQEQLIEEKVDEALARRSEDEES